MSNLPNQAVLKQAMLQRAVDSLSQFTKNEFFILEQCLLSVVQTSSKDTSATHLNSLIEQADRQCTYILKITQTSSGYFLHPALVSYLKDTIATLTIMRAIPEEYNYE